MFCKILTRSGEINSNSGGAAEIHSSGVNTLKRPLVRTKQPNGDPLFEVVLVRFQTDSGVVRLWSEYEPAPIRTNSRKQDLVEPIVWQPHYCQSVQGSCGYIVVYHCCLTCHLSPPTLPALSCSPLQYLPSPQTILISRVPGLGGRQEFTLLRLDDVADHRVNIVGFSVFNKTHPFFQEFVLSLNRSWQENCDHAPFTGTPLSSALLFDAVYAVVAAVQELNRSQNVGATQLSCKSSKIWEHGTSLMNYLRM
ncbi:hypothetical protein CHARACLAT_011100, partial [Characodon lateralis]|nr:hypothetical protein [Characodon lateralis]